MQAAVLHAISLARRLQDPLVEFCGLADESDTLSALFLVGPAISPVCGIAAR
jgi:hypothetical protein